MHKISEIEILLLISCLKHSFFRFTFDLKMHQLRKIITLRMSKHILSISCKGATNDQSGCFDRVVIANSMQQIMLP